MNLTKAFVIVLIALLALWLYSASSQKNAGQTPAGTPSAPTEKPTANATAKPSAPSATAASNKPFASAATPTSGVGKASETPGGNERKSDELAENPYRLFCGDGSCDYPEDCASCAADCGCEENYACNKASGACYLADYCGNGTCSASEKKGGACCQDCGCSKEKKCSSTGDCFRPVTLNENALNASIREYLKKSSAEYNVIGFVDELYEGVPARFVKLECVNPSGSIECGMILVVDVTGTVIAELRPF